MITKRDKGEASGNNSEDEEVEEGETKRFKKE